MIFFSSDAKLKIAELSSTFNFISWQKYFMCKDVEVFKEYEHARNRKTSRNLKMSSTIKCSSQLHFKDWFQ